MSVIKEEKDKLNVYAKEPKMYYQEENEMNFEFGWTKNAESLNGKIAMLSLVVMVIVYLNTGQLIPGVF